MAQAVNVLLDANNRKYDLNQMGLVSMEFNRFLGSTRSADSGVLSDMTITMFDKTGSQLLSILQEEQNTIKIQYGFENNLSEPYKLNVIKFNSTYNNLGAMVSIGAIGTQITRKSVAETYLPGTLIKDVLLKIAERNEWYIGEPGSQEFIDIRQPLKLDRVVFKTGDQTDMQFIESQILPIANRGVVNTNSTNNLQTSFWDFQLVFVNGRLSFFFRPYDSRGSERRIWKYSYGDTAENNIISLTNFIDFSFLVRGISIKIPFVAVDALVLTQEQLEEKVKSVIQNKLIAISDFIKENNLPEINPENFLWNVEAIPVEDLGDQTEEEIILNAIQRVINSISTIEIEIIGNPKIMPTDLIDLIVRNKDGDVNIISSTAANGSYWRVVTIQEKIGMNGYTTKMQLVREVVKFNADTTGSTGSGISSAGDFEQIVPIE